MQNNQLTHKDFFTHAEPFSLLSREINRVAAYLLVFLQDFKISANQITIASLILGVFASVSVFFIDTVLYSILLLWVSFLLDVADGMWARAKHQTSPLGGWLDQLGDYVKDYAMDGALLLVLFYLEIITFSISVLFIIILYFISKSLFYLIGTQYRKQIRLIHTRKLKLITFSPAEKYIVFWPILILFKAYILPVYMLLALIYTGASGYLVVRIVQDLKNAES